MKNIFRIAQVLGLLGVLASINLYPILAQGISPNSLIATISGLQSGEQATLTLQTNPSPSDNSVISTSTVISKGEAVISVDMTRNLKDGYYKLLLNAPEKYYRDPQAYDFMVSGSKVINPQNCPIVFKLVPPEQQTLKIYRPGINNIAAIAQSEGYTSPPDCDVAVVEPTYSLSAPAKTSIRAGQSLGSQTINPLIYTGSIYLNWASSWSGLEGEEMICAVTNPGVVHDQTNNEFIDDHLFATNNLTGSSERFIEIGWAEVSWEPEGQYMYTYWKDKNGSSPNPWPLFPGIPNPFDLRLRELLGTTTWVPEYCYYGYWTLAGYSEDLGIYQASIEDDGVEAYSTSGNFPSLPVTTTTYALLYRNNAWVDWGSNTSTTLFDSPSNQTNYSMTSITNYDHFSIYSN